MRALFLKQPSRGVTETLMAGSSVTKLSFPTLKIPLHRVPTGPCSLGVGRGPRRHVFVLQHGEAEEGTAPQIQQADLSPAWPPTPATGPVRIFQRREAREPPEDTSSISRQRSDLGLSSLQLRLT